MTDKYIGIENELVSFYEEYEQTSFQNYFDRFADDSDYKKSKTAVRTTTGNGFYVDGSEIEILTPPILINKGFATRLTDSLMIGRERVVKSIPELKHTGYSMHWNLTAEKDYDKIEQFYRIIAIPFHLFGLTPLSVGLNMRWKVDTDDGEKEVIKRYELLGDSINNEEQINALALMLGSYSHIMRHFDYLGKKQFPLKDLDLDLDYTENLTEKFLPEGRSSFIKAIVNKPIQAQQYLELFYKWIGPFVSKLGSKKEIQNLEDFIEARKPLEFDKFKYYNCLNEMNFKERGVYLPNELFKNIVLTETRERKVPLEGRLLGEIVKQLEDKIASMEWDKISYKLLTFCKICEEYHNEEIKEIKEISNIYKFARGLDKELPEFEQNNFDDIKITEGNIILEYLEKLEELKYRPDKDNSLDLPDEEIRNFFRGIEEDYECQIQLERFSSYYNNSSRKAEDIVCKECDKICYNKKKITKKGKN
ncbi:MAG: hypothetical protein Q7S33_04455 [Nanoarchaeota archaeon]|nr:hypothetical protein [Nanoarchaeota archaeon]